MKNQIILRSSFTEKLVFLEKPSQATRRALSEAGFRWNGLQWWRNRNTTQAISGKGLSAILAPIVADQPDMSATG